jgi:mannose-6-phosphate isomerase-like protein (cupin superfamily)
VRNWRTRPAKLQTVAAIGLCCALGAGTASAPKSFQMLGITMTIAVSAAQTHGASVTVDTVVPPGGGPPAHVHTREDETYVITRGHFRFWHGSHVMDALPGTVVYLPRNEAHQFLNVGSTPGEMVMTVVPAGIERMFLTISDRGLTAPKDRAEIVSLGREYGIIYVAPLAPPATAK